MTRVLNPNLACIGARCSTFGAAGGTAPRRQIAGYSRRQDRPAHKSMAALREQYISFSASRRVIPLIIVRLMIDERPRGELGGLSQRRFSAEVMSGALRPLLRAPTRPVNTSAAAAERARDQGRSVNALRSSPRSANQPMAPRTARDITGRRSKAGDEASGERRRPPRRRHTFVAYPATAACTAISYRGDRQGAGSVRGARRLRVEARMAM